LYERLTDRGLLIPHEEVELSHRFSSAAYKVLRPAVLTFVSYPYEWSFSQLQDAALLTLSIQREALERGMTLKDASAYNVQFEQGRPVFIDTLSFESYREGQPWVAYRQFCQHFLAPLALMSRRDIRLNQLLRAHLDGVPLDLASRLLPWGTRLRPGLLMHVHLHARAQRSFAGRKVTQTGRGMSHAAMLGLLESLEGAVRGLRWEPRGTEWGDYYEDTNYSPQALEGKKRLVREFLGEVAPRTVWDLGGNVGLFSRIASEAGIFTLSLDVDPAAVEKNYRTCVERRETYLLPLLQDLRNPSGGLGWAHAERMSLEERGPADAVLALALVHHLAIGNNLPLARIAEQFSRLCRHLIIEFVPKSDSQVQRLLRNREDIFPQYTRERFEEEFQERFRIERRETISDSERILFCMQRRSAA
jgi:ribosomal protein L11 methylase PrmA